MAQNQPKYQIILQKNSSQSDLYYNDFGNSTEPELIEFNSFPPFHHGGGKIS